MINLLIKDPCNYFIIIYGGYGDLNVLVIYMNLSKLKICENGPSIVNTIVSILCLFYISVKPLLRTIVLTTNHGLNIKC